MNTKQSRMIKFMELEEGDSKNKLHNIMVKGLIVLFICWVNYLKFTHTDLVPPYNDDDEEVEVMLTH